MDVAQNNNKISKVSSRVSGQDNAETKISTLTYVRMLGVIFVCLAIILGAASFLVLLGLTPIEPDFPVIVTTMIVNGILVTLLAILVTKEVLRLISARQKGKAAARMHIRIVGLFGVIAAFPAIIVAIVAGITLDLGLDRIFDSRSRTIVESSASVANSYAEEATGTLLGHMTIMANNLRRNRQLFELDRKRFQDIMTSHARGLLMIGASVVDGRGNPIVQADIPVQGGKLPDPPPDLLKHIEDGKPSCILPRVRNLAACAVAMRELGYDYYLYTLRLVNPSVLDTLQLMEGLTKEYEALESGRLPLQIAFALLYFGICLTILLSAIWMGIAVADRLVAPIRQLITAADTVKTGNLDVTVPTTKAEGELRSLSDTFNAMTKNLKSQRNEILSNQEQTDRRRRFTEAVLSGVSAGVVGVDEKGKIAICNSSAEQIFDNQKMKPGEELKNVSPELNNALSNARKSKKRQFRDQIVLNVNTRERILNVQVTLDAPAQKGGVITIDDITDLVTAQRTSAWADVARRIAHEIRNPLTPIQLSAERLKRRFGKAINDDKHIFDQCTETIIRQVADIGRMVEEFSSFARMPKPTFVNGDLADPIQEAVFLRKVGHADVEINTDTPQEGMPTKFDARLLSQAFGNLIKNAMEAIESYKYEEGEKKFIRIKATKKAENYQIDIIDNGKGLPQENRERLLEPYMTTREKGSGLGLAIVSKIIEEHNGTIQLTDPPKNITKRGAMVRIIMPITKGDDGDNKIDISQRIQTQQTNQTEQTEPSLNKNLKQDINVSHGV